MFQETGGKMSNYVKSIPIEEKRVLVQSRISEKDFKLLKKHKVKIAELIRQACFEAVLELQKTIK